MSSEDPPSPSDVATTIIEAYPALSRFFTGKVPTSEVHDLVQDTVTVFLEKDPSTMDHPRRFLFGIGRNKLLQHFAIRRGEPFDSQKVSVRQLATTIGSRLAQRTTVLDALRELPLDQQMALELRYGEGFKLSEVAEAMDKSLAQAKRYLRDGVDTLRAQLGDAQPSEGAPDPVLERLSDEYKKS